MLTYKRYQALCAIHIHVPGEPGNEAMPAVLLQTIVSFPDYFPGYGVKKMVWSTVNFVFAYFLWLKISEATSLMLYVTSHKP